MRDFDSKISVKEMQILDRNSAEYGITPSILMECAGYSAAQTILQKFQFKKGEQTLIVCGTGNNGGDGFVIARHLLSSNIPVCTILVGHPDHIRTREALQNWKILTQLRFNLNLHVITDSSLFQNIQKELDFDFTKFKIAVDCLLGTGVKGHIREPMHAAINFVNSLKTKQIKVVSIDIPSGIDPDTGEEADNFVRADLLITFHKRKLGLDKIKIPEIIVNPIGIPSEAELFVGPGDLEFNMPHRTEFNYKGQHGKVLIIGGSKDYSGAPALAGLAALQMGMDLVYVFAPNSVANVIRSYSPNLIVRTGEDENICENDLPQIVELIEHVDCVVVGPGLGTDPKTEIAFPLVLSAVKECDKPVVIDANAIKFSKSHKSLLHSSNAVLTPHAHEFFELTDKNLPDQTQFDRRMKFLEKTASEWGITLLVKGRYDYISDGQRTRINKTGTPEMAVGGTGDILTGILASMIALKVNIFDAACCAAYINGKLGEYYQFHHKGTSKNNIPLKSSDLLAFIPAVLKQDT